MLMSCVFFSSRRRHTIYWRDWSSDVCSSDLPRTGLGHIAHIHILAGGKVIALKVDIPAFGSPIELSVEQTVGTVTVALALQVGVTAHAMLQAVIDVQVQTAPQLKPGMGPKILLQILQSINALYAGRSVVVRSERGR